MTARHRGAGPLGRDDQAMDYPDPRLTCGTRPGPGDTPPPAGPDDPDPATPDDGQGRDGQGCGMAEAVPVLGVALILAGLAAVAIAFAVTAIHLGGN